MSMTPPKWFCISYSSAASETLGCTSWIDTLNRLNALHLNVTLLPRIVMSYVRKSCAACSVSNLVSTDLLGRDTCSNSKCSSKFNCSKQWKTSSFLISNFSTCLADKKHTLDLASLVQNEGILCKAGFPAAPLLCIEPVVYLLSVYLFAVVVGCFLP